MDAARGLSLPDFKESQYRLGPRWPAGSASGFSRHDTTQLASLRRSGCVLVLKSCTIGGMDEREAMLGLRRVLVADDEPDVRTVARLALETVGGLEVRLCAAWGRAHGH